MGKTIRRKNAERHGAYDWRDETRNDPKAGENYFHADMPNRRGRNGCKGVKEEANRNRRADVRKLSKKAVQTDDVESLDVTDKHQKHKFSDKWNWD